MSEQITLQSILVLFLGLSTVSVGLYGQSETASRSKLSPHQEFILAAYELDVDKVKKHLDASANVDARMGKHPFDLFKNKWTGSWIMSEVTENFTALLAVSHSSSYPQPKHEISDRNKAAELLKKVDPKIVADRDNRRLEIARLLVASNADLDLDDGFGGTALAYAVEANREGFALLLIESGARLDTKTGVYIDGTGDIAPIHRATKNPLLVKALIEHGVDVNVKDDTGGTPLHWVQHFKQPESFVLLLNAGAKLTKDKTGEFPYAWAPIDITSNESGRVPKNSGNRTAVVRQLKKEGSSRKAKSAQKALLLPARKSLIMEQAGLNSALNKIGKRFDFPSITRCLSEEDSRRSGRVRISIRRKSSSLAEAVSDVCNQTGLGLHGTFDSLNIGGAIGEEEVGGKNLTFAKCGVLLELSFSKDSMHFQTISSVPWYHHNGARFEVREFIFENGTHLEGISNGDLMWLPENELERNQGKIRRISGVLRIRVPATVRTEVVKLNEVRIPSRLKKGPHFLSIQKLSRAGRGWQLGVGWGYKYSGINPGLDYGHVQVLGRNGKILDGDVTESFGGAGSNSNSVSVEERGFKGKYDHWPAALNWTFVSKTIEWKIPVEFENCVVPRSVWDKKNR